MSESIDRCEIRANVEQAETAWDAARAAAWAAARDAAWDALLVEDDEREALHIWRKDDWLAGYIRGCAARETQVAALTARLEAVEAEHFAPVEGGEWLRPPLDRPFLFECCDCGLVHAMRFDHDEEGRIIFNAVRTVDTDDHLGLSNVDLALQTSQVVIDSLVEQVKAAEAERDRYRETLQTVVRE